MENKTLKSRKIRTILIILALFLVINPLPALDLGVFGGAGNLSFDSDLKKPLGDTLSPKAFTPNLYPLIRVSVSGESGFLNYEGGFERNSILRNRLYADFGIDMTYLKLEFGPFLGFFNTDDEIFNPGFSAGLRAGIPGIFFAGANASSSFGSVFSSGYSQKTGEISVGFWVPHVICSLNLLTQSYTLQENTNLNIGDSVTKYFFRADIFFKNSPLIVKIDAGYGILKRSYHTQSITAAPDPEIKIDVEKDELNFIYLGLQTFITINPRVKIFLSGEMPVYYWSNPAMLNPEKGTIFFEALGGLIFTF